MLWRPVVAKERIDFVRAESGKKRQVKDIAFNQTENVQFLGRKKLVKTVTLPFVQQTSQRKARCRKGA